ncbi:SDR family oxidoreductase [Paraburkholderia fungorum]|jgi:NAD(P)-dependent dehydrogenase (short-subunit alcohol dehydrogenase family)|uniref:NAD(P)-dependent dehydrogenase (Short-subunit alcohol dehydrogenase family) n=1 Tax=Paraburkholderia fungorum TaxID=134537 RepID=A0AAP5Q866_9BURK|nr:SDR family oxidoreductase [Paraburkholderia fungorum]MBB4513055.1 NAD(P)-dependent dehydrogenase (short-subunit alcohol dehydrogenase family) [Paraburkholderia fungorum]MBB6201518.1 NAD(P)-dependent dehydrogenase (short-subunit alcohol dehydrogenase family) [Paraburkholderia fungorum]MDT8838863.1 SDR family oxidoreductase [Paraburkholderia fungorum]PRZ47368.1 NAD(P)-dependent dehydrogenase (short-subunit alcohol dehydrogenase family) [Paraburkholderia fungorum]
MIQIDLTGQVAVVTGGSSGIGLATAELFLRAGASVAICGRDGERLAQAETALNAQFPHAQLLARTCDVLNADEVAAFAQAVHTRFGRADMLINNAGQGRVSTFADTSDDAWREELDLKYFSVIRPTRAFLPMLRDAAGAGENATVVCVNSLLALQPEPHMVATSSARAGVLSLIKSLAVELAPQRIRVNSILIGIVESGQWRRRYAKEAQPGQSWEDWTAELARKKNIPLGRFGRPEEAAQALFYLATTLSSYTTGSHIDVSGGVARHV